MIRLLFYSPVFPPSIGGVETIVYSLATGLSELRDDNGALRFQITFVTQTKQENFDDENLPFHIFRNLTFFMLFNLIRASDVVHIACPAFVPMCIALLLGKATVVEHHGFQNICPTGQLLQEPAGVPCPGHFMKGNYGQCLRCRTNKNWQNSLKQLLSTWVRRFLTSRVFANVMPTSHLGNLIQIPNAITIHHGIPIRPQENNQLCSRLIELPVRLVYQGRMVSSKGIGTLIEAVSVLHQKKCDFRLVVIGDGPEKNKMERRAIKLGIDHLVRFAGRCETSDIETIMSLSHILIVPSLAGEVFGLVVAENMARGMAIVCSDIGAFSEVLGSSGKVFCAGDASDLAEKLETLIHNPDQITRLGRQSQERAYEYFNRLKMINDHATLYQNAWASRMQNHAKYK